MVSSLLVLESTGDILMAESVKKGGKVQHESALSF